MAKILANYGGLLAAAMGQTLLLALCGLFFACIIGLVVGLMSVVKNRACNIIATIFVDVIRGVPMIVLAFYVFFAVPMLLNNIMHLNTLLGLNSQITLSALQAGTICLALNCGAYMAEIIRAGIESVDKGQMEAARSLGLTQWCGAYPPSLNGAQHSFYEALLHDKENRCGWEGCRYDGYHDHSEVRCVSGVHGGYDQGQGHLVVGLKGNQRP